MPAAAPDIVALDPMLLALGAIALLVLALVAVGWRSRLVRRRQAEQIETINRQMALALWGTGEWFWEIDVVRNRTSTIRPADDPIGGLLHAHDVQFDVHPDDEARMRAELAAHITGKTEHFASTFRMRLPGEAWRIVHARGQAAARDANGRATRIIGASRDLTTQQAIEETGRIAAHVFDNMGDAIAVCDMAFDYTSVNRAFSRLTGYAPEELIGHNSAILNSGRHSQEFYQRLREEIITQGHASRELWQTRKDGMDMLLKLSASVVPDNQGRPQQMVAVLNDITLQRRQEHELRQLANFDPLTGLPNRMLFQQRIAEALRGARREAHRIGVVVIDLDRFQVINDSLGHVVGDEVLKAVSRRLQAIVGITHTVARLGGDEFAIIVDPLHDAEQMRHLAQAILEGVGAPIELGSGVQVVVSTSIGIAVHPDNGTDADTLLRNADSATSQAKREGRRRVVQHEPAMEAQAHRRLKLTASLHGAAARGEFDLLYQPRISLRDGRCTSVEALLRWNHATLGPIAPDVFIPLAEDSGLIVDIGRWTLLAAFNALREWRQDGLDTVTMAINVSSLQMLQADFPDLVANAVAQADVPAACIELELTESILMENPELAARQMQRLRAQGIGLAIDDFGTGYSSLHYLKQLSMDTLKIDRAFIRDLDGEGSDRAIVAAIVGMASALGLHTVAEGAETAAQVAALRELGCDEVQGYHFARPMPADACRRFLLEHAGGHPL